MSPSIRDPRLNSAECVTKGHKPDIEATGRSAYRIRAILWSSFISVLILGPLLAFYALHFVKVKTENCENCVCCKREEKPLILSANYLCSFLLLLEIILVIYVVACLAVYEYFVLVGIILEGIAICMIQCAICKMQPCIKCHDFCNEGQESSIYRRSVFVASTNVALYHLFWLIIGIMVNPTWGVTVLLVVCVVIVALFYAVFMISDVDRCCSKLFIRRFSIFAPGFLGLCLAAAVPVLAGQSFYGRETADDILKTALLYVINFLALWMFRNAPSTTPNPAPVPAPPAPNVAPAPAPAPVPVLAPALAPPRDDEIELDHVDEGARRPFLQSKV